MSRTITIEHGGTTYYGTIATINRTTLGYEDHGTMTAFLSCGWAGSGISVGGYSLDRYDQSQDRRIATAYGLDHIITILRTVGVDTWESLAGREVIILFEHKNPLGRTAAGIAGLTNGKVMIFAEHAATFPEAQR